jgi:hypothetical protein
LFLEKEVFFLGLPGRKKRALGGKGPAQKRMAGPKTALVESYYLELVRRQNSLPNDTKIAILKQANLKVMAPEELNSHAKEIDWKGNRFAHLTVEKNRPLIESLADAYAKIFNAGLFPERLGIEKFYIDEGGVERFCFVDLKCIVKLPAVEKMPGRTQKILLDMRQFYESISFNDRNARVLFVSALRQKLNPELRAWFEKAIGSLG